MTTGGPGATMRPETVLPVQSGGAPFPLSDKSDMTDAPQTVVELRRSFQLKYYGMERFSS